MQRLVPKAMHGWKAEGRDRVFDRKTIYDYLDGGAEAYLTYDFRQLFSRRFAKSGAPSIIVDMFDMGSAKDAFGIFTFERDSGHVGIGQDSEYAAGLLRFWKGRYFVAITAERETPASRQAALSLGRRIAAAISSPGKRPDIIAALPSEGLLPLSVRYFHTHSALNYHYFLAHENILNLDRRTEAVLARYAAAPKKKTVLLVVRYPDAAAAARALRKFVAAYMPEAQQGGVARLENRTWAAVSRHASTLVAVFESPREGHARTLIADVKARLTRR